MNPPVDTKLTSYDQTEYESHPFFQSHPDRIATLATLFGMKPKAIDNCKVLELGCASGGNLIPIAAAYPNSQFVGIDLSIRQIENGKKTIDELGLKNIELRHFSIMDVNEDFGKFDYIIAHGVFSWVDNEVQEKIIDICSKNLEPQGVAYISYNVYPGWHHKGMIRDMMMYHTKNFTEPETKAAQARALLDWLSTSVPVDNNNAHGIQLKRELDLVRNIKDYYLIHEYLEDANQPVYFYEFAEMADRHGLQYLSEADFSTMLTSNFPKEVAETLRRISTDIVRTEQFMDFVRNRQFRQTLLCHKDVELNRNIGFQSVMSLFVSCQAKPLQENINLNSRENVTFGLPDGRSVSTPSPLVKAALLYLSEIWPQAVSFDELVNQARARISDVLIQDSSTFQRDMETLGTDLVTCYTVNLLQFRTSKLPITTELSDKPKVSDIARHQAKQEFPNVTSQSHEMVNVDVFARHIIQLLDGTRTRDQVLDELVRLAKDGTLVVQKEGKSLTDDEPLRQVLANALDEKLAILPKTGILVG